MSTDGTVERARGEAWVVEKIAEKVAKMRRMCFELEASMMRKIECFGYGFEVVWTISEVEIQDDEMLV